MILLCGIPSEPPLAMVREALAELGAPTLIFNQRHSATTQFAFTLEQGRITGTLTLDGEMHDLESIKGIYLRLMDEQSLPELDGLPPQAPERRAFRNLHDALLRWAEITPSRVVNRYRPMGSNASKPYQAQLIAKHGFFVPETLITNDPELAQEFYERHKRVIYKSISGVRSIVQELTAEDLKRLEHIRWCPTQFQAFVAGTNVRVHVVGQEIFATRILSEVTDYRYAHRQGGEAELSAVELSEDLAEKCVSLAAALELPFAGIDLKITPADEVFCFEVNPSPGFSYYENNTGQPIALAVARYLCGGD
jgi:glutathione synthase/RimK-type ligase-like ATP-grasp enzyme